MTAAGPLKLAYDGVFVVNLDTDGFRRIRVVGGVEYEVCLCSAQTAYKGHLVYYDDAEFSVKTRG